LKSGFELFRDECKLFSTFSVQKGNQIKKYIIIVRFSALKIDTRLKISEPTRNGHRNHMSKFF